MQGIFRSRAPEEIKTFVLAKAPGTLLYNLQKIKNRLAPSDTEIQFANHQRLGVRASIPAINTYAQMSIIADYNRSFRARAA